MTQQHPIGPPPELMEQWRAAASNVPATLSTDPGGRRDYIDFIATRAAQWGADQELEACCEWLLRFNYDEQGVFMAQQLRAARRPKPPSLKEQALEQLDGIAAVFRMSHGGNLVCDTIRRALEQLDG